VLILRKLRILLCVIAPAWALGALLPASAPAAQDMFFQADGLLGESQSDKYKDAIDVLAWSWGASNAISATSGLTSTGKATLQDLSLTKYVDRTSPVILSNLVTGKVIPKAKLTIVKAGENPLPYLRLCFTGVRLTSMSTGGSSGEDRLTENVGFGYATVVEAYQQQLAGGTLGPTVFGGWDLINRLQYRDETC
jgi:type VI secretion system secreted protein Hcp